MLPGELRKGLHQAVPAHSPTQWKAKQGEMQRMGLWLETRKHFPMEKPTRMLEGPGMSFPGSKTFKWVLQRSYPQGEGGTDDLWRPSGDSKLESTSKAGPQSLCTRVPSQPDIASGQWCHRRVQHSQAQLQPGACTLVQPGSLDASQERG